MTFRTILLLLGLLAFVAVGLAAWFAWFVQKVRSKEPIPPVRSAFQLLLFVGVTLIWLSGIVLSEGGELDDLLCLWVIMAPAVAFGAIMAYFGNKKRNISLKEHEPREKSTPEG